MQNHKYILIAGWIAYLLIIEICFLIYENNRTHGFANKKRQRICSTAKWTGIICTVTILTITFKDIILK